MPPNAEGECRIAIHERKVGGLLFGKKGWSTRLSSASGGNMAPERLAVRKRLTM